MSLERWQGRSPLEAFPVSIGLLGACAILFVATDVIPPETRGHAIKAWGANSQLGFASGQLWRPITSMFLHGNLLHVALNMFALWQLCPTLERNVGSARFTVIYFGAGIAGALSSMLFEFGSLGASGAICGVMACFLRFERVALGSFKAVMRDPVGSQFAVWLVINIVLGFTFNRGARAAGLPGISNACHIGGIVGGWLVAAAVIPSLAGRDRGRVSSRPSVPKCVAVLLAIGLLAAAEVRPIWSAYFVASQAAKASETGDTARALKLVEEARHAPLTRDGLMIFDLGYKEHDAKRYAVAEALYAMADDFGCQAPELLHNQVLLIGRRNDKVALLALLRKWNERGKLVEWQEQLTELEAMEARGELKR